MKRLESRSNQHLRRTRSIVAGNDRRYFVAEGSRLVQEAVKSDVAVDELYVTESYAATNPLVDGAPVYVITETLMRSISDLQTPPGILAVLRRPVMEARKLRRYAILLFEIRDPGNAGTIIRTAEAAGADYVAFTSGSVDPFSPKVVRGSMGSIFRLPVFEVSSPETHINDCKESGATIYTLDARGTNLFQSDPAFPALLVLGSEAGGVPDNVRADVRLAIPMEGQVESLNAAVAAALGMYFFYSSKTSAEKT